MGADLLLVSLPAAEITEDRKRRLHEIVSHLDETRLAGEELQHIADDPESVRDKLHQHIELLTNASSSREVAKLRLPHVPYAMLFTGGLSWGDDPTEMFETFERSPASSQWSSSWKCGRWRMRESDRQRSTVRFHQSRF